MCYSPGMETTTAPDLSPGYPSEGAQIGPAWIETWRTLSEAGDWMDGQTLWQDIAPRHNLKPVTLRGLLFRMAGPKGPLVRESRKVNTPKGIRSRTHFRIKEEQKA